VSDNKAQGQAPAPAPAQVKIKKEQTIHEDVDGVLASAGDPLQYPVLAAALASAQGEELRHEMVRLLAPQLHVRAPRRYLRVICRLEGATYDEPVLLTDISATGVRFLVLTDVPLDVTHSGNMRLHVKTQAGQRTLNLALVRRIGGDARHTDVACRFLDTEPDHQQLVTELRSTIFGAENAVTSADPVPVL
jgi:hypothetical protein